MGEQDTQGRMDPGHVAAGTPGLRGRLPVAGTDVPHCLLSRQGLPTQGREVLQPPPLTQARLRALTLGAVSRADFSSARAWFIFPQENHQRQRGP